MRCGKEILRWGGVRIEVGAVSHPWPPSLWRLFLSLSPQEGRAVGLSVTAGAKCVNWQLVKRKLGSHFSTANTSRPRCHYALSSYRAYTIVLQWCPNLRRLWLHLNLGSVSFKGRLHHNAAQGTVPVQWKLKGTPSPHFKLHSTFGWVIKFYIILILLEGF